MFKKQIKTLLITFLTLIPFGVEALGADNVVRFEDLYEIDGVYYKKFTSEPFSGVIKEFSKTDTKRLISNEYYENGKIVSVENFCPNGRLRYKRNVIFSKKSTLGVAADGLHTDYLIAADGLHTNYHCNGKIESKWSVKNGVWNGERTEFDELGAIIRRDHYLEGELNGISETFYKDGTIKKSVTYKGGQLNGPHIEYYENGNIRFRGSELNGQMNGVLLFYGSDGQIKRTEHFKKGKRDGVQLVHHKTEGITEEWLYKNGIVLKPLSPLVILDSFPICSVLSSKGQFCKSLDEDSRQTYNFNKLKKSLFKPKVDWPNLFELKSTDWRYSFELVSIRGFEKKTFLNPNTMQPYEAIVGNKAKLIFTDEALKATYYTVVTYDLEFNEDMKNWFLVGSVVDDIRGSEDDRKVIGQYRKYDPPIPFLDTSN